jgi:hypothetical protein
MTPNKIAAANAGRRLQFRFAVHGIGRKQFKIKQYID